MVLITIVTGAYKSTYNWGPHIVDVLFSTISTNKNQWYFRAFGEHPTKIPKLLQNFCYHPNKHTGIHWYPHTIPMWPSPAWVPPKQIKPLLQGLQKATELPGAARGKKVPEILRDTKEIRWMEEILHQLIEGFNHPRWCRISSIHRYPQYHCYPDMTLFGGCWRWFGSKHTIFVGTGQRMSLVLDLGGSAWGWRQTCPKLGDWIAHNSSAHWFNSPFCWKNI